MALTLGPIARPTPIDRRAPAPAPESFDPRPAPNRPSVASGPGPQDGAAAATTGSATASHPARRSAPQSGPASVGCECCGRLATADTHLARTVPPSSVVMSSSAADRVAARYLSNVVGRLDEDTSRSVVS